MGPVREFDFFYICSNKKDFLSFVFKAAKISPERFLVSICGVCYEIKPSREW